MLLPDKSPRFGSELKNRQAGRVINIYRCAGKFSQISVQPFPLVPAKLSVEDFLTLNLAHVGDKTVYQLYVVHLKREEGYGLTEIHSNVLGQRQRKRGLTHGGTSGNDYEVRLLPSARHVVKLGISCRNTGQSAGVCRCLLQYLYGLVNDRVYLGIVLLHIPL